MCWMSVPTHICTFGTLVFVGATAACLILVILIVVRVAVGVGDVTSFSPPPPFSCFWTDLWLHLCLHRALETGHTVSVL